MILRMLLAHPSWHPSKARRMSTRMSTERVPLWLALCFVGAGLLIVLVAVGVVPVDPDSLHAPPWVLATAGVVFATAGVAASMRLRESWLNDLLALLVIGGMAVIGSWISFGPGEREFSGSFSFGPIGLGGPSGPLVGRIAFGIGAVMLWAFVVFVVLRLARRLSRG